MVNASLSEPSEVPYFQGDFWPGKLEECVEQQEKAEVRQAGTSVAGSSTGSDGSNVSIKLLLSFVKFY